jgi:hypothetical protein
MHRYLMPAFLIGPFTCKSIRIGHSYLKKTNLYFLYLKSVVKIGSLNQPLDTHMSKYSILFEILVLELYLINHLSKEKHIMVLIDQILNRFLTRRCCFKHINKTYNMTQKIMKH